MSTSVKNYKTQTVKLITALKDAIKEECSLNNGIVDDYWSGKVKYAGNESWKLDFRINQAMKRPSPDQAKILGNAARLVKKLQDISTKYDNGELDDKQYNNEVMSCVKSYQPQFVKEPAFTSIIYHFLVNLHSSYIINKNKNTPNQHSKDPSVTWKEKFSTFKNTVKLAYDMAKEKATDDSNKETETFKKVFDTSELTKNRPQ